MLELQIERIRQSRLIDRVIIATTAQSADDPIEALAARLGCPCFRGSEDDVLGRVASALSTYEVDIHVEFQGDNPMPDALLVDSTIGYYLKHAVECDYVTNGLRTTYPPGAEVSVYPAATLIDAERHARSSPLREHVGLHIHQHPERYRIRNLEAPAWLRRPALHLEVDTDADFGLVTAECLSIFTRAIPGSALAEVIALADANPELAAASRQVERRWRAFRMEDRPGNEHDDRDSS